MYVSIILVLIAAVYIKYKLSKKKTRSNRTASDNIIRTIGSKMQKSLQSTANALRDPEAVKEELKTQLKSAEKKAKATLVEHLTTLEKQYSTHQNLTINLNTQIKNLSNQASNLKVKFLESKDPEIKTRIDQFLVNIVKYKKQLEVSQEIVAEHHNKVLKANTDFDLYMGDLQIKAANLETADFTDAIAFDNITIDDLSMEYSEKKKERDIYMQVEARVNTQNTNVHDIPEDAINALYEQL